MPVFAYRALTTAGRAERGIVDADSQRTAWQQLRARGIYPIELRADATSPLAPAMAGTAQLAGATRQLAALVAAGVPVADALAAVAEETEVAGLRHALTLARARLREGASLADALTASPRVFPPLYCALVRAGEASGALGSVLERLAVETEAAAARRAALRSALVYPAVMTTTTALVLGFLVVWVVPQVTRLFAETGTPLPLATRALLAVATLLRHTWWAWVGLGMALAASLGTWRTTTVGRAWLDAHVLRVPVLGRVVAAATTARLARMLATVLGGGLSLDTGLAMAGAATGNTHVAAAVGRVREAVRRGEGLAPALRAQGLFPATMIRLVATGERTGALADAFARGAAAHEVEVERAIAAAMALVEPALVILMGTVVLVLVLAILVPILTLSPLGVRP